MLRKFFFNKKASGILSGHYRNAINLSEIEGKEWNKIVPVGDFPRHPDGAHRIESRHIRDMVRNKQASDTDLLVDIDHFSFFGMRTEAAAWIAATDLEAREDGLYAKYPTFTTDEIRDKVKNRVYRYLSPVYSLQTLDKNGVDIGATIDSLALTNRPYMDREIDHLKNSNREHKMNEREKELLQFFGLGEDATVSQITQKLNSFKKEIGFDGDLTLDAALAKIKETKKVEPEGDPAASGDLLEKINSRLDHIDQLNAQADTEKSEALVQRAIDDGKILPVDKEVWLNSAKSNYDDTRQKLDARQKNSALPGKVEKPSGDHSGDQKTNAIQAATEFFKSQGRAPLVAAQ